MSLKKEISTKSKIGIAFVVLSFIAPVIALTIPFLGLSKTLTTFLVAIFMVGGPEVFLIIGGALAGKDGVVLVKNKIKKILGLPEGHYPASKTQYNIALFLIFVWALSFILPYIPVLSETFNTHDLKWYYFAIADIIFIISFVFIGGDQLITKVGRVFKWEKWELPLKKDKH